MHLHKESCESEEFEALYSRFDTSTVKGGSANRYSYANPDRKGAEEEVGPGPKTKKLKRQPKPIPMWEMLTVEGAPNRSVPRVAPSGVGSGNWGGRCHSGDCAMVVVLQ